MATAKPKPKKKGAVAAARKKQPPWLWIGVAAVVLILAVAAIASSGGSGSDEGGSSAAGVEETRPVSISGSALPELPRSGSDPAVGTAIPEATGQSFDGSPVTIRNDGRAKLLVFVAHWCPHCRNEIPLLADWLKSNERPDGVDVYAVSTAVDSKRPNYPPSDWLKEEGWTPPTLADSADGKASEAFGLSAFPYFVAVDSSGKVVARTTGEIGREAFTDLARRALGNQ